MSAHEPAHARGIAKGVYYLGQGHTAPTVTALGVGPARSLGVFDLCPEREPEEPLIHQALAPLACPGGATLALRSMRDVPRGAIALQLWLSTLDRMEPALGVSHVIAWPGAGDTEDFTGELARPVSNTDADTALVYLQSAARNALELLTYTAQPGGAVVDLAELAGGARYVQAWLRSVSVLNPLHGGNDLAGLAIPLAWEVRAGRPPRSSHAQRWVATAALMSPSTAFSGPAADVFDSAARRVGSLVSPLAGRLYWNAENGSQSVNGFAGVEVRAGASVSSRDALQLTAGTPSVAHQDVGSADTVAGSIGLYYGTATGSRPALFTTEVVR